MADLLVRPNGTNRNLVGDFFGFDPFRGVFANGYQGGVDVQKTENGWTVELPVPGYKPDQIDVTVEDRVLTVSGKSERRSFQRSILLPEDIGAEAIEAKVEHGMLTLGLQLHPKAQPRKIEIKVVN
ncbi:MAG TPA: Hsp20/alpha crystallin family protein [Candidatus Elarobacter sp.]|jgi:HSP20 family protein